MTAWRVSWIVDLDDGDAETPLEAARMVADVLAEEGAPHRSTYLVADMDTAIGHTIDLDLPENGGAGYFS